MITETIVQSETLTLSEDGFYNLTIESGDEIELTIRCLPERKVSLFVECAEAKKADLKLKLEQSSHVTLFFWNSCQKKLVFHDEAHLNKDAVLHLAYGELADGDMERISTVHLDEEGAEVQLHCAALSANAKNFQFSCIHHARNTLSLMKNYFVLLEGGSCKMDAIGKIDKGAGGAKSHQVSRGLTFDQQKQAIILPQLLIDENDVEASHATTLGQIDENQMYYMQSRGLSRHQATQLITTGYLLPITDEIEEEALRKRCRDEIELRVNQACLK